MNVRKTVKKRVVVSCIEDMTPDQFQAFMNGDCLYTTDLIEGPGYFSESVEYTSPNPGRIVHVNNKEYIANKYLFYE